MAKAVHNSNPLSWIYPGMWAETKVILNPHTKKPKVKSIKPLWLNASFNASGIVCSLVSTLVFTFLSFLINEGVGFVDSIDSSGFVI